jgi:acyl-CoA hydrolase
LVFFIYKRERLDGCKSQLNSLFQESGGMTLEPKFVKETRCFKTSRVFPPDVNNHNTMFGGKLMSYIDDIASISASKLCRETAVTASTDSVDFLYPIRPTDAVSLESFVTWTGHTSMEVFVKVITENLRTGEKRIAATSFLTFVGLNEDNKRVPVAPIIPETEEEKKLYETAKHRAEMRKIRREESKKFADYLQTKYPLE